MGFFGNLFYKMLVPPILRGKEKDSLDYFDEGVEACNNGHEAEDNPYPCTNKTAHRAWEDGWIEAHELYGLDRMED